MNATYKPLRIEFTLANPVKAPSHPIHLDGLLAWAAVQEGIDAGVPMEIAQEQLPLARQGADGDAVWMASWIEFSPGERDSLVITRPFRVQDVVADNGRSFHELRKQKWDSDMRSSPYKAYIMTFPLRHARAARAWCIGEPVEVERLLKTHITHLGKLARLDLGRIANISVTEDIEAYEKWRWRSMPWALPGYARAFETIRAPYWKRENRREAWVPLSSRA